MARRSLLLPLIALALLTGCGESSDGSGSASVGSGCLSSSEVNAEVNRIAEGFETSSEEVDAKQNEIAAVRAREC